MSVQLEEVNGERPAQMIPGEAAVPHTSTETCSYLTVLLYPAGRCGCDVTSCGRDREASSPGTKRGEACGGKADRPGPAGKLHHERSRGSSAADDAVFRVQRVDLTN